MLVKGDWVVKAAADIDGGATERQIRRLNQRTEKYPVWLVVCLLAVTYFVAMYGSATSTGTLSLKDYVLLAVFGLGMSTSFYMVFVPESRCRLRGKLCEQGKLYPATNIAYQLVMIDPIVHGITQDARVEYHVSRFLQGMRYHQLTHKTELWFLEPDREAAWRDTVSSAYYAAVLCGCEEQLDSHIKAAAAPFYKSKLVEVRGALPEQKEELAVLEARHDHYIAKLEAS